MRHLAMCLFVAVTLIALNPTEQVLLSALYFEKFTIFANR
jgi:hypothetical protein